MSNSNKVPKSISFNKTKAGDQRILKATARRNFSKFMKTAAHFYLDELEKQKTFADQNKRTIEEKIEEIQTPQTAAERLEQMRTQIKKTDKPAGPKLFKPQ